jgi:hypothetical protein
MEDEMRRLTGLLLGLLISLISLNVYAVGSCTVGSFVDNAQAVANTPYLPGVVPTVRTLTVVCTADSAAATYPSTTLTMTPVMGWALWTLEATPGGTAPTNNYVVKLNKTNGMDALGGAGGAMSSASTGCKIMPRVDSVTYKQDLVPVIDNYSLVVTGNLVNSAVVTFTLVFVRI